MSTRRIVCLYAVVAVVRLINTVSVNSVTATIKLFSTLVCVIRVWEDVESIDHYATGKVKADIINDDSLSCLRANNQRVSSVVAVNTDCFRRNTLGSSPTRITVDK